jgi:hypothetical protein
MPATLSDIRTTMQTQASGASGGGFTLNAARVVLGYKDVSPNNSEFLASLAGAGSATAGPFLIIKPGDLADFDLVDQTAIYEIPCDLWLGITRETDDTFVNIETFLEAIKTLWKGRNMAWRLERPLDLKKTPIPVHYELLISTPGC